MNSTLIRSRIANPMARLRPAAVQRFRPNTQLRRPASNASGPGQEGQMPGNPQGTPGKFNYPLWVILGVAIGTPLIYISSSTKAPGSGQAEIKAARREKGTADEYRDPRDSPIKDVKDRKT